MTRTFKTNKEYFDFYNKYKEKIRVIKIKFTKTSICINYEMVV